MSHAFGRKSIFITGAASGIGAATAKHFSRQGWFCGLYDVNAAGLADTARALGPHNSIEGVLDVRDRGDWQPSHHGLFASDQRADECALQQCGCRPPWLV